jgi:long-subunit acyl-CoA synthetase (AMP-forming)
VAPFASAAERAAGHWRSLVTGGTRTLCRDPAALIEALRSARPTFLFGSPRLWQGVLRYLEDLESPSPLAEAGLERISWAITAGASCPPALRWRLLDLGVRLRELYGMTETGGATITAATVDDIGTVGQPMPGWQVRIGQGGEVHLKADHPSDGYMSSDPSQTFRQDGWVRTGDLGAFDAHGRLCLTGRIKEVIVPLHGHNVSPAALEGELLAACPQIAHACVVGDGRPHLAAIIAADSPAAETAAAVERAIEQTNRTHDQREHIKRYRIVRDQWLVGQELTETLKLRRDQIAQRYATEIEQLYAPAPSRDAVEA